MEIKLERVNQAVHFVARNAEGAEVHLDGSPVIGGQGLGMRPMELVLTSLAGCSAMDVVAMLQKRGRRIDNLDIRAEGDRAERKVPQVFTDIRLVFEARGDMEATELDEAVAQSMERFCSVAAMLRPGVNISWEAQLGGIKA